MAAPSYAQAMREAIYHPHARPQYAESEGEASSIPDIVSVRNYSDTDDNDSIASSSRSKRNHSGLNLSALRARLHQASSSRDKFHFPSGRAYVANHLSPVPSSPSINGHHGDAEDSEPELSRAPSMYSLSRISFSSRLGHLTSIPLPTASSLSARITSQPTAHLAARSLSEAGEQIKSWITKASEVLADLDAQDDVEWSSAGGHEGVEEVEQAINRFEGLVKVYIICIEEIQLRADVRTLSDETLKMNVDQMEDVAMNWAAVKRSLKSIKEQVETALEWEELWNVAMGEVAQELNALGDLIFQMEEDRHKSAATPTQSGRATLSDLASMVEAKAATNRTPTKSNGSDAMRFSPGTPVELATSPGRQDESKLMALSARMHPVRTSLDFLPMRLSAFHTKASVLFPTGCIELETRRDQLEVQWKKIETDAEALKKELAEDRWLAVFRNAGSQALQMFDSVDRSLAKASQAMHTRQHQTDPEGFAALVENFEAKKTHYLPAIDRVLALIDRGAMDRSSVNGEILRLQSEMKRRYVALQVAIKDQEVYLKRHYKPGQQLRDSVSTIATERSRASSALDTPHSSPASSIVLTVRNDSVTGQLTPATATKSGHRRAKRVSNIGIPPSRSRLSDFRHAEPATNFHVSEPYVGKREELLRDFRQPVNKPRFSLGGQRDVSPAESPRRQVEASPRRYTPSRHSLLPVPGSIDEGRPVSPAFSAVGSPLAARRMHSAQLPRRASSAMGHRSASASSSLPSPSKATRPAASASGPKTPSALRSRPSMSTMPTLVDEDDHTLTPSKLPLPSGRQQSISRPTSALSHASYATRTSAIGLQSPVRKLATPRRESLVSTPGRRSSFLPLPTPTTVGRSPGRESRTSVRSSSAMGSVHDVGERPKWRH